MNMMDEDHYWPADIAIDEPLGIRWWQRVLATLPSVAAGTLTMLLWCTAPRFASMLDTMLGGEPLPVLTTFYLQWWAAGMASTGLIALASAIAAWHREWEYSGMVAEGLALVVPVTVLPMPIAMYLPFIKIIDHLD